ncbi:hypothetical protein RhiirA4_467223 [Rhizophagus irregularis]|uniref:Uncharacterized protein n=1 Tax=Rhizophagus irregularis TaxID=588596 RepID=A0A2I1GVH9_9GLOM|nr:hypothetical protein RhiirA4_467223 [Rhizophagus irregularis]
MKPDLFKAPACSRNRTLTEVSLEVIFWQFFGLSEHNISAVLLELFGCKFSVYGRIEFQAACSSGLDALDLDGQVSRRMKFWWMISLSIYKCGLCFVMVLLVSLNVNFDSLTADS